MRKKEKEKEKMTKYFVSRQAYYSSHQNVVEIAVGGIDYSGPAMLTKNWYNQGEGQEFLDPRDAAQAAQRVVIAWALSSNDDYPRLTVVNSGGMGIEGEPMSWEEVQAWAEQEYERLPKCERCGEIIPGKPVHVILFQQIRDEEYCSEYCAEKAYDEAWAWHFRNWLEERWCEYQKKSFHLHPDFREEVLDHDWVEDFDEGTFFSFDAGLSTRQEILDWFNEVYPGGLDALIIAVRERSE